MFSKDYNAMCLHIYPQTHWHGDAEIVGTSAALRKLGEALIAASHNPAGRKVAADFMPMDGEGYNVNIRPATQEEMARLPMPYATMGHSFEFERVKS